MRESVEDNDVITSKRLANLDKIKIERNGSDDHFFTMHHEHFLFY